MLVRRNTTSVQCACSVIGYLAVVTTRGTGGRIVETDAFGNVHYHQSYVSKLHKPLLIGSAASSFLILLILAVALSSNLFRNSNLNRRKFINSIDQFDRSIKNDKVNEIKQENKIEALNDHKSSDKTFNQLHKEDSVSLKELKELDKQIYRQRTFNSQYCSQTKLNWLILIVLFAFIQLFWCSGVLFPGDEFTIYKLWKKLLNKFRGQNVPKPIYISSSWSLSPQIQQVNHLVTSIESNQQYCLNVGLILHFLFISCNIWMILNSFHLYQHLKRSKFNDFKFDLFFNYSSNRFPFNCCSFNYAKSTEDLISKQYSNSTSNQNSTSNSTNQISSIEQLVEEINQKDNDRREDESVGSRSSHQIADNLIKRKNNSTNSKNCPISCSPSKLPKRRALSQRLNYLIRQIRRHLSTFAYYSITWFVASFITILTYKLNPAGYETKR